MAATPLSTAVAPPQFSSGKYGVFSSSTGLLHKAPKGLLRLGRARGGKTTCMASSMKPEPVPDSGKRELMKLLLLGAVSLPTAGTILPGACSAVPPGGTVAKDDSGNDVIAAEWLKTHGPDDRTLAVGLKDDPTYIVVESDGKLSTYGISAICTHEGCVVPWDEVEEKFMCPCHGSQYNSQGKVVRGPAPLSLALVHAEIDDGKVVFSPWMETDFRTGEAPWWA